MFPLEKQPQIYNSKKSNYNMLLSPLFQSHPGNIFQLAEGFFRWRNFGLTKEPGDLRKKCTAGT